MGVEWIERAHKLGSSSRSKPEWRAEEWGRLKPAALKNKIAVSLSGRRFN
jgi:hypothetical protein